MARAGPHPGLAHLVERMNTTCPARICGGDRMSVGKMLCAGAAAAAVAAASGCSSGPAPRLPAPRLTAPRLTAPRLTAPRLRRLSNGGISGYWTRSRLLDASPLRGLGYRRVPSPGQSAKAHPSTLALRVGALF